MITLEKLKENIEKSCIDLTDKYPCSINFNNIY